VARDEAPLAAFHTNARTSIMESRAPFARKSRTARSVAVASGAG